MAYAESLERRIAELEQRIERLEEAMELEYLTEEEEEELRRRIANPEFISEKELRRELGVED